MGAAAAAGDAAASVEAGEAHQPQPKADSARQAGEDALRLFSASTMGCSSAVQVCVCVHACVYVSVHACPMSAHTPGSEFVPFLVAKAPMNLNQHP